MPKAKPVSLHPLSFEEAIKALISVPHEREKRIQKTPKRKRTKTKK
jgi:hypothetical protein